MEKTKSTNFFLRFLFKIYRILKDKFDPPKHLTEEEKYCVLICTKLIKDRNTKLTYTPLTYKRYITNENNNMFVVIFNNTVLIINHVYSYTIYFEDAVEYSKLMTLFDEELEERRLKLEDEVKNNIQHSLKKILDGII